MACKVSLQSLLATLIAISVANNGNGSAQVAGRCIAYVRPATRIPSALLHVVPMPAWEQRELVDIAEIVGGGTPDTNNSNYWDGDIDWYAPAELGNNIYAESSTRKITQAGFDSCSTKMLPADKTILFTSRAGIGNTAILRHSACTNQGFQSLVIGDADVYFVYSMSERIKKWAEEKASGSTFLEISGRQLETMPVNLPSLVEQQAIGSFFSHLDDLITLHQRKYDKLVIFKKSMLEKMFPKDGESVPEIRFAGFTDPWEQRKLGELALTYSGGTPSAGNSAYYGGEIPFIRSAEIDCDSTELSLTVAGLNNSSAKLVDKGMVLYAMYGATSGEVAISKIKGAINQAILAMDASDMAANRFIAYWLRRQKKSITETFLQGGQGNLSGAIIKELGIPQPSLDEQRQIGSFFSNLDDLITLHQRKLELLQNIKKSLLDKMFV